MEANTRPQLNSLVNAGIVESYPPLVDKKGSYTAQFEHVSDIFIALVTEDQKLTLADNPHPTYCEGGHQPRRRLLNCKRRVF